MRRALCRFRPERSRGGGSLSHESGALPGSNPRTLKKGDWRVDGLIPSHEAIHAPPACELDNTPRRLIRKSNHLTRWEEAIAKKVRLSRNRLSLLKLIVTPWVLWSLIAAPGPLLPMLGFAVFGALDALDALVAQTQQQTTRFGRILDRLTDYPLLFGVAILSSEIVPAGPLFLKLGFDIVLFAQFSFWRGTTENRLRTGLNYATVLAVACCGRQWIPELFNESIVTALLWLSASFGGTIILHNARLFQRRFIADLLSMSNLCCGLLSIHFASVAQFPTSLLLLLAGAGFDGLDWAAARRFDGTSFGVYSDDIADAVNYGIAPGFALYFAVGGLQGFVLGGFFTLFTLSRLAYFTLNKTDADPGYFSGTPRTVGGILALCAAILFPTQPALIGLSVGAAVTLMVSFQSRYAHLERWLSSARRPLAQLAPCVLLLIAGHIFWSVTGAVAVIFAGNLLYGFWPTLESACHIAQRRLVARGRDPRTVDEQPASA